MLAGEEPSKLPRSLWWRRKKLGKELVSSQSLPTNQEWWLRCGPVGREHSSIGSSGLNARPVRSQLHTDEEDRELRPRSSLSVIRNSWKS